jgi:hypothetical protein
MASREPRPGLVLGLPSASFVPGKARWRHAGRKLFTASQCQTKSTLHVPSRAESQNRPASANRWLKAVTLLHGCTLRLDVRTADWRNPRPGLQDRVDRILLHKTTICRACDCRCCRCRRVGTAWKGAVVSGRYASIESHSNTIQAGSRAEQW